MEFKINPGILGRYKNLNYDPWYAIAEYLDNSLHSFLLNRKALKDNGIEILEVNIAYDPNLENGLLRVIDNSIGMDHAGLEDALEVGRLKSKNSTQLSEFGMGMKTASIWLGNELSIRTKYISENVERTVIVNIERIISNVNGISYSSRDVMNGTLPSYTIIEVKNHNRKFQGRTLAVIQQVLQSMYGKFIEDGILRLIWNNCELKPERLNAMVTAHDSILRKDFSFDVNGKNVSGFVGILEKGAYKNAGFSIYRNNRLIKGYPESNFRPQEIFSGSDSGSNNLVNQRVYGELIMDDFEVTHTKDDISFQSDEEAIFRSKLKSESERFVNMAKQGLDELVKGGKVNRNSPEAKIIRDELDDSLKDIDLVRAYDDIELEVEASRDSLPKYVENEANADNMYYETDFAFNQGKGKKRIQVYLSSNIFAPYLTIDEDYSESTLKIIINIKHPYVAHVQSTGNHNFSEFLKQCALDALVEAKLMGKDSATINPNDFRIAKNTFLKLYVK